MTTDIQAPTQINDVPCTIHLRDGAVFEVEAVAGWSYVPQGIFASGHFSSNDVPRDILIPEHSVSYIELDFKALERYVVATQQGDDLAV